MNDATTVLLGVFPASIADWATKALQDDFHLGAGHDTITVRPSGPEHDGIVHLEAVGAIDAVEAARIRGYAAGIVAGERINAAAD
jgi:hypothetical protein